MIHKHLLAPAGLAVVAVVAVMAAASTPAHAAPAAPPAALVERALHTALDCSTSCYEGLLRLQAPLTILPSGETADLASATAASAVFGDTGGKLQSTKLGKITIGMANANNDLAWFQAPLAYTVAGHPGAMRVSGVVVKDEAGWKIAAIMFSEVIPDAELAARAAKAKLKMPTGAPKITGDDAVTGQRVVDWFGDKLARQVADDPGAVASGTSSAEYQTGKQAAALAATWDKLKIVPTLVDVHTFGTYIKMVRVKAMMPTKAGAVPLALGIVVLSDTTFWQWGSLQYSPGTPATPATPGTPGTPGTP